VQVSILGHVLCTIFVSPLFDIVELVVLADETLIQRNNLNMQRLIEGVEKSLEVITNG
jgi:hypothetical protein